MSTEFLSIAKEIAEAAAKGGLSDDQIGGIARSHFGEINCYPGVPGDSCHQIALFCALHGQLRKGKGHYNFEQILDEMIRHMQGRCPGVTRHVVLIVDVWWHDHYEKWRANIETMKRDGVRIEAYLTGAGGWVAPLPGLTRAR